METATMEINTLYIHNIAYHIQLTTNDDKTLQIILSSNQNKTHYTAKIHFVDYVTKIIVFEVNNILYKAKLLKNQYLYLFNTNQMIPLHTQQTQLNQKKSTNENSFNPILLSPLSGRILKIHTQQNQLIQYDQPLLIIESMKMENEIRSTQNNVFIKTISIVEGDLVQTNQILITFEKMGENNGKSKNPNV